MNVAHYPDDPVVKWHQPVLALEKVRERNEEWDNDPKWNDDKAED